MEPADEDALLLRRFAVERSDAAFTALVARKINLVYSAALRQASGDPHLAAEVTQSVFVSLARKAGSLREVYNLVPLARLPRTHRRIRNLAENQRPRDDSL